jgi:hypothetical protein
MPNSHINLLAMILKSKQNSFCLQCANLSGEKLTSEEIQAMIDEADIGKSPQKIVIPYFIPPYTE